jgi:hypothetical protein
MYSLQKNDGDTTFSTLGTQIVMELYKTNGSRTPILLDVSLDGVNLESGNVRLKSIELSFPMQEVVVITTPKPAVYRFEPAVLDEYGDEITPERYILEMPREPKTVKITARMNVIVEIDANGRTATSRAIYRYTDGMLSDDPDPADLKHAEVEDATFVGDMVFTNYGKWELIRYENIDSKN